MSDVTKVVILGIEYRYRSLSSTEVSSIDVIAGIVLTLNRSTDVRIILQIYQLLQSLTFSVICS